MANLDFYATVEDHRDVLIDLFREGDVRVFKSYSAFDADLREFTQPEQIIEELRQVEYPRLAVLLQIWAPAASKKVEIERFPLSVPGYAYRHRIAGWGLMQLYLSKEAGTQIQLSHFGHFNQRGAEVRSAQSSVNPGTASDWDWQLLRRISRRVQYRLRSRFSEMKVGSRPVLKHATRLLQDGYRLAVN